LVAVENHTIKYFRAPKDHFWHWTDNGTVIAWENGNTICYRDDLFALLQQVNSGLPPLSPLLLLLTACARPLHVQDIFFLNREVNEFTGNDENSQLHKTLKYALKFLDIVAELPANLRTGQKRVHLIYEVFSGASFTFENSRLRDAILELNSGRMDNNVFHLFSEKIAEGDFINCLLYFCTALQKYPTLESLIVKLRTGLDQIPEAAPVLLPEANSGSLYDQLLQDPETAGIARVARRLAAALNIPMQSKGSSDQPFGGISDITNRGNYDKLLLSELAHDDELLMARLVNNEALYFRREEPPENPKMQRIVLMDSTLKMWGTSRLFALANGLACAQQNKHGELLQAYTLGGTVFTPVSLNSKHGIIQALGMLDPALHCGMALEAAIASTPVSAKNEFIFITHARLLRQPAFYTSLAKVKQMISFIITVTDTGELHLYECINGISKLISNAKIDLDELLSPPQKPKVKKDNVDLPAFLAQKPSPLYFPAIRVKYAPDKFFVQDDFGALAISETQRVFLRKRKDEGAVELLSYIEKGSYTIGISSDNEINILVNNRQRKPLRLYRTIPESFDMQAIDLPVEIEFATNVVFKENKFYIESHYGAYVYDCIAGVVIDKKPNGTFREVMKAPDLLTLEQHKRMVFHKYFNNYESIFFKVKNIHINGEGKLVLGKHELYIQDKIYIRLRENYNNREKKKAAKLTDGRLNLVQNKSLVFALWVWDDGSEAIVDPRGFLHLKSDDAYLPEKTIVMVLDRVTACWASDNSACGSHFFIDPKAANIKTAETFYNEYIQKFIDRLI
jgi:hypothetical protein